MYKSLQRRLGLATDLTPFICHSVFVTVHLLYFILTMCLIQCWRSSYDCLFVGCLTSQQQASVSQGRICSDNFTCCHTEIEVADQTFYLTQSQYTDSTPKKSRRKRDSNPGSSAVEADALPLGQRGGGDRRNG